MSRKYALNKRAAKQENTRRRIVEAAVALHEERGPARTTISAIAERAGVERLTVYRHFPEERAIFEACSTHYNKLNPPPDPSPWREVAEPGVRLQSALRELYHYFETTEPMLTQVIRDAPNVPAMNGAMQRRLLRQELMVEILLEAWSTDDQHVHRQRSAAIRLAIDFSTWRSLTRETGITSDEAATLVAGMVGCIAP